MSPSEWTPRRRIEEMYRRQIMRLLSNYLKIPTDAGLGEITRALADFSSITQFFQDSAIAIASRMATQLKVENARSWREAARQGSRGREIYEALQIELQGKVGTRMLEIVDENARLISSIPADIRAIVNREISAKETEGLRPETIARWLRVRVPELTRNKAALIARTETSKSATSLTRARSEDLGIPAYLWATSEDQRVRPSHRLMDYVIVFWDDPPNPEVLAHEKNVKHGPYNAGQIYNCRCDSYPILNVTDLSWPHKVYRHGQIVRMRLVDFRKLYMNNPIRRAA